ncbi:hypothetical protein RchiOBHm_Chr7g0217031 [Rosa chinensis]|uniref:Uncharacterized protein n=1 Tax=Rosa chinensis TaxID=74649 RepID=A0A2P6PBW6_ROSCH|nr:hypothetical protein RchiOBHm_Chr7g0217031 [Rosa chinensis]
MLSCFSCSSLVGISGSITDFRLWYGLDGNLGLVGTSSLRRNIKGKDMLLIDSQNVVHHFF